MVPDTPEQRWDTISITEGTYFEDEITMIPETPETESRTQISTDIFYKTSSTARKLNFDINEIKHLGKPIIFIII